MKESKQQQIKRLLKPYRAEIDRIDDSILELLGKRFGVVRKVARVKIKHDIPSYLGDRVKEVRERNATRADKYGIDPEFLRTFYTMLIYQSCATEDLIKFEAAKKKRK